MEALDLLVTQVTAMREEQRTDHTTLVTKVDSIAASIIAHSKEDTDRFAALDRRFLPVETMHKTMRWAIGTMFAGLAYGVFDFLVNHLPKLHK
jgi:hypothetical protein